MRLPLDVPVQLGRDQAQQLARVELARPEYQHEQESWVSRAIRWLLDTVSQVITDVGRGSHQVWVALLGIVLVVALVVVAVRWRTGPLRTASRSAPAFDAGELDPSHHRAEAERLAAEGAWAEAVRARLRAVVRDLEARGLVDARPGRTADEIARDAGAALPPLAGALRDGARYFDDVWYGGRPADRDGYARLVALDDAVAAARPGGRAASPDVLAVPR